VVEQSESYEHSIAQRIEHTCLKPDASSFHIAKLCNEAKQFGFAAVCVNPSMVSLAVRELHGSEIPVASVANFPLGQSSWNAVDLEISESCANGAEHIDLVLPLHIFLEGDVAQLSTRIQSIRDILTSHRKLKCIVELSLLDKAYWKLAFEMVRDSGADVFKTGTGFFGGVTVEMVTFLRDLDPDYPIKASGGIATQAQATQLLYAGATLLGTSRSVEIITNS
jgi:deoxyribose-phosphate aldolase